MRAARATRRDASRSTASRGGAVGRGRAAREGAGHRPLQGGAGSPSREAAARGAGARLRHAREPTRATCSRWSRSARATRRSATAADAARAYGSIIDLFPARADLRRFAGERLERLPAARPLALAIDTYRKAVEQRPDHPAGHRLLGVRAAQGRPPARGVRGHRRGAAQRYPAGRFAASSASCARTSGSPPPPGAHAEPARAAEIRERLARAGGTAEDGPSIRFVLNWETDANDVDFHIHDAHGGHAFYSQPHLPSGGELYADVTTGYGPECFTIRGAAAGRAAPYHLQAHYYSRGPMGYGMGKLEIIEHDGNGSLRFDERPFVIMEDGAFVDLGQVGAALGGARPVAMAPRPARKPVASRVWATAPAGGARP